jgi:hypothetical protein
MLFKHIYEAYYLWSALYYLKYYLHEQGQEHAVNVDKDSVADK